MVYFPCQWWSNADNEVLYQSRILWHPPTHPPKGWEVREEVAGGLAPAVLLCELWGVSQNLILWEPLQWQGIPAENWCPHPCHGHSRGPPPLDLQQQEGNTHASLLPTLSSQWVTGPQADGQFVFGWFRVKFLLVVSHCWANSERSRTAAVWLRGGMRYRLSLQCESIFCCFSPLKGHGDVIPRVFQGVQVTLRPSVCLSLK